MAEEALQGAAVKYLLSIPEVVASVGKFVSSQKPFIFQDDMNANLEEGHYSAVSAIVVEDGGPLAVPGLTRFRARRLAVHIWANGNRDAIGNLLSGKVVEDKIDSTFKVLDKYMHRTNPSTVLWETTYTYGCDRIGDISKAVPVIDGDGIKTATVYYSVLI
jgi:hypothetical protein